jgi:hypothetical protein
MSLEWVPQKSKWHFILFTFSVYLFNDMALLF